uniref:Putative secreted protein ovary overexpressed n=1 Tax=Rhipicephalus microplus TaxID=6941 RepID=A0A6M2DBZ3_RHIMP
MSLFFAMMVRKAFANNSFLLSRESGAKIKFTLGRSRGNSLWVHSISRGLCSYGNEHPGACVTLSVLRR